MVFLFSAFLFLLFLPSLGSAANCNASTEAQFDACLGSVGAGDSIILADGTYTNFDTTTISLVGTLLDRITIRGTTSAGAVFNGNNNAFIVTGSFLTFKWLKFTNRTTADAGTKSIWEWRGCTSCTMTEVTFSGIAGEPAMTMEPNGGKKNTNLLLDQVLFENVNGVKIWDMHGQGINGITVQNSIFRNSTYNTSDSILEIGNNQTDGATTVNVTIRDCLFENISSDHGVFHNKVSGVTFTRNTFRNTDGMMFRQGNNTIFEYNTFIGGTNTASSVSVIRANGQNHTIRHNIFDCDTTNCEHHITCPFGTGDIPQHYTTCAHLTIANNVFRNASNHVLSIGTSKGQPSNDGPRNHTPHDITIRDNILASTQGQLIFVHPDINDEVVEYNHYFATGSATNGSTGTNSTTGDPQFVNVGADNFNIQNTALFNSDSDGRDRGAHFPLKLASCKVENATPTVCEATFTGGNLPVAVLAQGNLRPFKNDVLQTISTTSVPSNAVVNITLSAAVGAGDTVKLAMLQGAVENARNIGGTATGGADLDSENPLIADGAAVVCTNNVGGGAPSVPVYTQTHVQGYVYDAAEGTEKFCAEDGICLLMKGYKFVARAQIEVETAAAPARAYEWWCSDNGGAYYEVTSASTGWVSLTTTTRSRETPLIQKLPLNGDTFQSCGVLQAAGGTNDTTCSAATGRRFEYEMAAILSNDAVAGQSVVCRLRGEGGAVLDAYTESFELSVVSGTARGF